MKNDPIGIRLSSEERAALEAAAAADERSMSALGRKVITDWLRANGWLDPARTPAKGGMKPK